MKAESAAKGCIHCGTQRKIVIMTKAIGCTSNPLRTAKSTANIVTSKNRIFMPKRCGTPTAAGKKLRVAASGKMSWCGSATA